jgi:hypothetical protein
MTGGLTSAVPAQFPPPNYRPPSPIVMTALNPSVPDMMSTPRKGMTDPVLSQPRNKLDASLAQRLNDPYTPQTVETLRRSADESRPASNEYISFLNTT